MSSTERLDYIGTVKLAIQIEKLMLSPFSCIKYQIHVRFCEESLTINAVL